uniref:Integrase catalytic domain-containing protein n=1 Tax=Tanacetum cinerariifolium TaxID=118510 RepID=A0A699IEX2_TANCI|nr:hypothetical protein [Tanacetum cinerariifolium]
MARSTRLVSASNTNGDEGLTREYLDSQLAEIRNLIATLGLQQNQAMNQGRQANQFGRLAKVEFPKFHKDDVRGWVFRCDQFFHIDNTPNEEKVKIVSVYLSDKALLWHRQVTISQEHAISLYLGGLPTELQMSVRMFKHATLTDAYSLTRLQEAILEAMKKKSKPAGTFTSNRFGNGGSYGSVSKPTLLPKPNTPNVLVNAHNYRTLKVKGTVGKHTIHILVDCGSTHNFVDVAVAKKLGCPIKSICPLAITVGDGYNVATTSVCKKFKWQLQGMSFCSDVMLLPLVGCEMILGIQWLSTLDDIKFKELRMEFMYENKKMVLRGTPKSNSEWMSNHRQNNVERQGKQPEFSSMQLCVYPSLEISLMKMEGTSKEMQSELQQIVEEFADVFAVPKELPPNRPCNHRIPLLEGTNPVNIRPYRHPPTQKEAIKSMNVEAQSAFEHLKQAMISARVLALPDFNKEFTVETGASGFKKGMENVSADALSRIQSKAQLFILFSNAPVDIELLHGIEATWEKDVELKTEIQKLKQGKHVKNSYVWTNQQLRRKGKLVVGKNDALRTALMTHFHSGSVGGHVGVQATLHKLCSLFYWRKMRRELKQFVRECDVCQRSKLDLSSYPGLLQPLPIPNTVWSSISMDFVEGLPKSQGKNVIMVVVDRLSKYSHFISLAHPFNAPQIAQIFLDNIYKLHGFPKSIVSDRDKVFIGLLWKELFKLLQVKLLMSTAYHPRTDGQTEVVNRSLECYLRSMCGEKPKELSKWLSLAEWWYNTNYQTALNTTPYEVLYGPKPPIHIPYVSGESRVDAVDKTLIAREEVIQLLRFHLKRTQDRMKMQENKNRSEREFIVVQAKIGAVAYKLILSDQAQIHDVFHVSQLKKCKGQQIAVGTLPQYDGNGLIQAQPVAILDRRLGKVGNAAGVFILVQWTNSDPKDATWESTEDIQKRFPEFNALA